MLQDTRVWGPSRFQGGGGGRGYTPSLFRLPPPPTPPSLASLSQHLYNLRVSGFCRASPGAEGITVSAPCLC